MLGTTRARHTAALSFDPSQKRQKNKVTNSNREVKHYSTVLTHAPVRILGADPRSLERVSADRITDYRSQPSIYHVELFI